MESDGGQLLWHYTSSETAFRILESGYFHCSHFSDVADTTELQLLPAAVHGRIAELMTPQMEADLNTFTSLRSLLDPRAVTDVFVGSLAMSADDPKMWQDFGGGGHGVALGFRPGTFTQFATANLRSNEKEVRYFSTDEIAAEADTWARRFIDLCRRGARSLDDYAYEFIGGTHATSMALLEEAPFVKHLSFAHEREFRVLSHGSSNLITMTTDRGPVRRDRAPFSNDDLAVVMLGPRHDGEEVTRRLMGHEHTGIRIMHSRWRVEEAPR